MNPYQEINNLDKLIDSLEKDLNFSRNKSKDTKNINTLINARNCFEEMLDNKYHTDVVMTLIYDKMLTVYRDAEIRLGGDINDSEQDYMMLFSNMFALGSESKKQLVIEELRLYLDLESGITEHSSKEEIKAYSEISDKLISDKMKEAITKIKSLITFNLK